MQLQFKLLIQARKTFNAILKSNSLDFLNSVPVGFRNNIVWNIGHSLVTQEVLCFKMSNLPMIVDDRLIKLYGKGSIGDRAVTAEEVEELRGLLRTTSAHLMDAYQKGDFKTFNFYKTSYGFDLDSIEAAISFNNVHEGIHMGYVMAQMRQLNNQPTS